MGSHAPMATTHKAAATCKNVLLSCICERFACSKNVGSRAETVNFPIHAILLPSMSTTARITHNTSPRSRPVPADTDLPNNENTIDMNAVTEEPVVSIKVDLNKNMSSTLEQIRDQIMPSEERVVSRNM
ncbi:hypothetical protein C8R48DRAFT_310613 [Suillus tomentosus]|nr:hypothetical protein C8R48DRAFT_310613 [Suillus tomentosus]